MSEQAHQNNSGSCECGGAGPCCNGPSCALSDLGYGECAVVHASELPESDGALLRAMGLRPEARVRVCRKGSPCIVEIDGAGGSACRVGVSKEIALRVLVRRSAVDTMLSRGAGERASERDRIGVGAQAAAGARAIGAGA